MNNNELQFIQTQIGYPFKNSDLLQQAFIRRSYSEENGGENNEVLEFIGDKALDFIIVKKLTEWYGSYSKDYEDYNDNEDYNEFISDCSEGKLTEIKKKLVCKSMLANRIRLLGFQYSLIMGKSDIKQDIENQESVQEDLFEAIIGAVVLDSDWDIDKLTTVIDLMLEPNYYLENGFDDSKNYVDLLQKWYQKKYNNIPYYCFRSTGGFSYAGNYGQYICELGLHPIIQGFSSVGETKSEARMKVAEKAYKYIEENGLLYTMEDEVGEPDIDRAINQLQELYQKGYIDEPWYDFKETYDNNGNPVWRCECHVKGRESYWYGNYTSKKQGKKAVAYNMLCEILNVEN